MPCCHLSQFATPRDRDGKFTVLDRKTGKSRPSTPNNEAHERDLYAIDVEGVASTAIEDALGKLEGTIGAFFNAVNEKSDLPSDDELRPLCAFIALQATRSPSRRSWMAGGYDDVMRKVLAMYLGNKDAFLAALRRDSPDISDADADEVFKLAEQRLASGERIIEMDQTTLIKNFLDLAAQLEDLLMARRWILGVAPASTEFVTSDDPVLLMWRGPEPPPAGWSPGFGRTDTIVAVRLGRSIS